MQISEIKRLLHIKEEASMELDRLVYGTVEIRDDKYIYVHYRKNNKVYTRYVSDYSEGTLEEIKKDNLEAKRLKKIIRQVDKELKNIGYVDNGISEKVKLNIDFVKRNLVDTIYKQSILEGISTTEADTENIIEGGIVTGMTSTDVMKILNLKQSWDFILDEDIITLPTDFNILSYINKLVINNFYYNAGIVRSTPVKITGTDYIPPIPFESKIKEDINRIIDKKISHIDKAIELLLYVMKNQVFIDGNKRTAVIFANHYLISKGLGLIVIPVELVDKYRELLIEYYEGKNTNKIKDFIKTLCYIKF